MSANIRTLIEMLSTGDDWCSIRAACRALREGLPRPDCILLSRFLAGEGLSQRPDFGSRSVRVAVASDASLDNLAEPLSFAMLERGLFASQRYGAFAQIALETRDPQSMLWQPRPDAILLAPLTAFWERTKTLAGSSADEVVDDTWSHVTSLRQHYDGMLLLQNLILPESRPHGIADSRSNPGRAEFAALVNVGLSRRCRETGLAFVLDAAAFSTRCGTVWPGLHKQRFMAGRPMADDLARQIAAEVAAFCAALKGFARKCLALDLDNTLWGGVVGEDGTASLKIGGAFPGNLYTELQKEIRSLRDRGVTLALVSKNNEADAWEPFDTRTEMILRREDFSASRINWQDKASNLREIAAQLNLGLDSFVLMDDHHAERALVEEALPEIEVCPYGDPLDMLRWLSTTRVFDTMAVTQEDALRAKSYAAADERTKLASKSSDLESYLAQLETEITVAPATGAQVARVAQLTQKTNQFNLSTRRYTEAEIQERMNSPSWRVLWCSCRDRFTDEGIVGVAIIEVAGDSWRIDTLLLSCRVLGRGVEKAFLSTLVQIAAADGATVLAGEYVPSPKNAQTAGFFASCGFSEVHSDSRHSVWRLPLPAPASFAPPWIRIIVPSLQTQP